MMYWTLLLTVFLGESLAHSWNEQLTTIINGTFTGRNGYSRGYISRSDPGFRDSMMVNLLPSPGSNRTRIDDTDLLCAPAQRTGNQTANYPRLQVSPGSYVAMKYLENGHVTIPQNQLGKPSGAGTVYVFGTGFPSDSELLTDVLQWNDNGTGGNKRGKLLVTQNFDDGRCYQINNGSISLTRQKLYPNPVPHMPGLVYQQWCETDVMVPLNVPIDSKYSLYWVWQWPTRPGIDPALPEGKDEYYTTCSDVDVVARPGTGLPNPLPEQDPQTAAVGDFRSCGG